MTEEESKLVPINIMALGATFSTTNKGSLGATVKIEPLFDADAKILSQANIQALFIPNAREFTASKLNPLSRHRIVLNKQTGEVAFDEILTATKPVMLPTHCNFCYHVYDYQMGDSVCKYFACPANSLSCLRSIVHEHLATPDIQKALRTSFFKNYLVGGEPSPIENLYEFKVLFQETNAFDKATSLRRHQWLYKFGGIGLWYWAIECQFQAELGKPTMSSQQFWLNCCFPAESIEMVRNLPADFFHEGHYVSPRDWLNQTAEAKRWYVAMSDRSRLLLESNNEFIKLFYSVHDPKGNKQWI